MTPAVTLLDQLHQAGVALAIEGEGLVLDGPTDALPDDVVALVRLHKTELVLALQGEALAPSFQDLRRRAGDLAAAVNGHLTGCQTCKQAFYVTDESSPCCRVGADLKRRYREVRQSLLAAGGAR